MLRLFDTMRLIRQLRGDAIVARDTGLSELHKPKDKKSRDVEGWRKLKKSGNLRKKKGFFEDICF